MNLICARCGEAPEAIDTATIIYHINILMPSLYLPVSPGVCKLALNRVGFVEASGAKQHQLERTRCAYEKMVYQMLSYENGCIASEEGVRTRRRMARACADAAARIGSTTHVWAAAAFG